jgi:hypothetical protein
MKHNFPKLSLSEPELIWMTELYSKFKAGDQIRKRDLLIDLREKIPTDFDPRTIDRRLAWHGTDLTLLGIWHIEPNTDLIHKTHQVILANKHLIISDKNKFDITAVEVAEKTGISVEEVSTIFRLIDQLGSFWSGGSGSGHYGLSNIGVRPEQVVEEYLRYKNVDELMQRFFIKFAPPKISDQSSLLTSDPASVAVNEINFNPIFHSKITQIDPKLCFVLMPFSESWSNRVYYKLIRKAVEDLDLQCIRADNLTGQIIIEDIWTKINQCAFIIADVTTKNPNVMYELGIAHTIGKPVILITQDLSTIPFDFTHLRHFEYEDNVEGFAKLSETLPRIIKEIYRDHYSRAAGIYSQMDDDFDDF